MERPRLTDLALGAVVGVLLCASLPPWGWWPAAPVGIALWLHLLDRRSRLQRFATGWCVGVAWFGISTLWMWGLSEPGYVAATLLGWGPLVGAVSAVSPGDRRRLVALPAAVMLFEWFHSHAPFGGVPLSLLSMSQARGPLLGIATSAGSLLLTGAVCALGVALYLALAERRWREPVAILLGVALLTGVGLAWPRGGTGEEVEVALVQGGGPQRTRFTAADAPVVTDRHLSATRNIPADAGLDLVVWPENTINVEGRFRDSPYPELLSAEAQRLDATIVVGVVEDAPRDPDAFLNYVVAFEPDGTMDARYDKERRVPFGEYVPVRPLFESFAAGVLPPRDQVPGTGEAVLDTDAGPLAVAISWEVFFSRRVREGVRAGGEIVVNPTNGSSYWLTQVQTQQVAASALRAAESGRWTLQAAPTGFSAVVDDHGRVLQRTGVSESAVLYATVPRLTGTTPAQALGDLPGLLAAAAALLLVGRPRWRRLRDLERSTGRAA